MNDPVLVAEIPTTGRALLPVSRQGQYLNIGMWQLDLDGIGQLQVALDQAVRDIRAYQASRARVEQLAEDD